jgi:hypothetical protein
MAYAGPIVVESSEDELQDGWLAPALGAALGFGTKPKPSVKTGMGLRPRPPDHPPPGWTDSRWRCGSKTADGVEDPATGKAEGEGSTLETLDDEALVSRRLRITELQNEIGSLEREAEKRRRILAGPDCVEEKKASADVVVPGKKPKPPKSVALLPTKAKAGAKKAYGGRPASFTDAQWSDYLKANGVIQ